MLSEIVISTEKSKINIEKVVNYLQQESYWAKKRSREVIIKSIEYSKNYSFLLRGEFIGFARIITDYCTIAYLCDVFILEKYQKNHYGKKLMEFIINDNELAGLTIYLSTKDAHEFYKKFGFTSDEKLFSKIMYKP